MELLEINVSTQDEAVQDILVSQGGMSNPIFLDFLSLVKTKKPVFHLPSDGLFWVFLWEATIINQQQPGWLFVSVQGCDSNTFVWCPGIQCPGLAHVHRDTITDHQALDLGQN